MDVQRPPSAMRTELGQQYTLSRKSAPKTIIVKNLTEGQEEDHRQLPQVASFNFDAQTGNQNVRTDHSHNSMPHLAMLRKARTDNFVSSDNTSCLGSRYLATATIVKNQRVNYSGQRESGSDQDVSHQDGSNQDGSFKRDQQSLVVPFSSNSSNS